jgi:hypothetical protein
MITAVAAMVPMRVVVAATGVADFMSKIQKRLIQPAYRAVGTARVREICMSVFAAKYAKTSNESFVLSLPIPVSIVAFECPSVTIRGTDELTCRFGQVNTAQAMVEETMHMYRGLFELRSRMHRPLVM